MPLAQVFKIYNHTNKIFRNKTITINPPKFLVYFNNMDTNFKNLFVVILISITTIYSTCHKPLLGCESSYSFVLNPRVYPDKDTIFTGDTIWVGINSSDTFMDFMSNHPVKFDNAENLGTSMGFIKLMNASPIQLADAVNDFNFILINGEEIKSPNVQLLKEYLIHEINGIYKFTLGIIPKSSGTYSFNLGNAANVFKTGQPCPKASFLMKLTQTNQHYYLYPGGSGVTPAGADYYFYVK